MNLARKIEIFAPEPSPVLGEGVAPRTVELTNKEKAVALGVTLTSYLAHFDDAAGILEELHATPGWVDGGLVFTPIKVGHWVRLVAPWSKVTLYVAEKHDGGERDNSSGSLFWMTDADRWYSFGSAETDDPNFFQVLVELAGRPPKEATA